MKPLLEAQLLRRLKWLGCLLIAFAIAALFFERLLDDPDEMFLLEEEVEKLPPLNPVLVSSIFAMVGSACLLIYWKKRKTVDMLDK
jgi:hypothetical protein